MSWPEETAYERYPSDLTDKEWEIVKPILEKLDPYTTGRPRQIDLREVINAIFYLGFRSYLDLFHQITSHQRAKTSYLEDIWPHLAADFAETSYPYEIVCVKVGKALQFLSIFWA